MLFNSIAFVVFLPIVYIIYWLLGTKQFKVQNILLLVSSYIFYGWWDYRFLFLLIFSTALDYFTGFKIHEAKNNRQRKLWLYISIIVNLSFLFTFKYYNFFIQSWIDAFAGLGYHINPWTIKLVLPVGISFYTFHGLSYVLDIYHQRIKPTRNWVDYSLFVSYFPLLVAGPIERATHLLPQISKARLFNQSQAIEGVSLMIWGFFKKIVVADTLAPVVNDIFTHYKDADALTLVFGAIYFSIQIYGDFSGYSDIGRGVSKMFGIELFVNFNYPYLSRSIAEFWRRWHISLSSWFRDYVYIPLGGSRVNQWTSIRNILIVFLLSGMWHGANWTYIIWGLIHALLFIPSFLINTNRNFMGDEIVLGERRPSLKEFFQIIYTFTMVTLAWIFFRSESVSHAIQYLSNMSPLHFSMSRLISWHSSLDTSHFDYLFIFSLFAFIAFLRSKFSNQLWLNIPTIIAIVIFGNFVDSNQFIYFQF